MGLFTNRKRDEESDHAGHAEAASMLARFASDAEPASPEMAHVEPITDHPHAPPIGGFFSVDPIGDFSPVAPVDDSTAAPIAEITPLPTVSPEAESDAPPRRRLEDRPRAQAGNVEIDASGLLELLGVDSSATLIAISEAHQRFLADHHPVASDDGDAAEIKEAIRREVNTAYASFRLTHAA